MLTFREILHECTAFEVAGASKLDAKDQEEIVSQVAQEVVDDEELTTIRPQIPPGTSPTASQRILQGKLWWRISSHPYSIGVQEPTYKSA